MDKIDGLEMAYGGGLLAGKASFLIEGTYDRATNWGRGMTVIIKGASTSEAEQAVRKFGFVQNGDRRNSIRPKGKTVYLTTFIEGLTLAQSLGVLTKVKGVADLIRCEESKTINLSDHSTDILIAVCERVMKEVAVGDEERQAFESLLINAFEQGMRGLTLGSSDMEALARGEGIADRYANGDGRRAA